MRFFPMCMHFYLIKLVTFFSCLILLQLDFFLVNKDIHKFSFSGHPVA